MNIRIHIPDNETGVQLLAEKVAIIHKEAIIAYLDRMLLTKNERATTTKKILNYIQEEQYYGN